MQSKFITTGGRHRTFRLAVWTGRILGWLLLIMAILAALHAEFSAGATGFSIFPPVLLGLVAIVWIVTFELFLHFFDRYLSRN